MTYPRDPTLEAEIVRLDGLGLPELRIPVTSAGHSD